MGYWLSLTGLTWAFNYRYEGGQNIPLTGPALLLANHQSFLDPCVVGCADPASSLLSGTQDFVPQSVFRRLDPIASMPYRSIRKASPRKA